MKIISTDIKAIRRLTKYISPANIEKARYKNFNAPKITETPVLCDEFFRTEELFNRKTDILESFHPYSVDDLPIYDRTSIKAIDLRKLEGSFSSYVESDLPYYVDIIGEKKRIYVENFGTKNSKYPYEADADAFINFFSNTDEKLFKGHSIDEIVNITYYAQTLSPQNSQELRDIGLKMLNDGFPLEGVISIMKDARLKGTVGETALPAEFMRFLSKFPNLRRYMITYSKNKGEVFDRTGAMAFPKLVDMCGGDTKEAYKIIWACRLEQPNESYLTSPDFLKLARDLYRTDKTWTEEKSDLLNHIKELPQNNEALIRRARKYVTLGSSIRTIKVILTPPKLRRKNNLQNV
jgi:hypothetical protein